MRTIKFRAWDGEKMTPAFYMGSYLSMNYSGKLMQYTGLNDKNGKEIYEGDVCCIDEHNVGVITFRVGSFLFRDEPIMFGVEGWDNFLSETKKPYLTVIGNIYENPDLLK